MMREILFRGKRIDNGEWVEGYYVNIAKINSFISTGKLKLKEATEGYFCPEMYAVDSSTICQYTGLTDKNGKKIWENDIVEITEEYDDRYTVKWDEDDILFVLVQNDRVDYDFADYYASDMKVIGNIFDDPELMEGN